MIEGIVTPGMGVNCYLVSCDKTGKAILVDPGAGSKMISNWLKEKKKDVEYIVLTHGHWDHLGAVEDLRRELGVKVAVHKDDAPMLTDPKLNLSYYSGRSIALAPAEVLLEDNQILKIGEMEVKVLHTPGHTPGGICLLTKDGLLSGDTLFSTSIGRTDFPNGDLNLLLKSIREKLMVLDDNLPVYPGHEEYTSIGRERKYNPYLNGLFFD
ncbi:MAG: MBL fold metallo-hydrolase [Peptococcaceae bacterium]|nr:MBL fold metallo-hydrolase [Peptococcaceae bacterium]